MKPATQQAAARAAKMLATQTPGDPQEVLADALADLRHYAEANGLDYFRAEKESWNYYLCEKRGAA